MTTDRLARHLRAGAYNNAWANHRLLRACSELDQDAFAATGTPISSRVSA